LGGFRFRCNFLTITLEEVLQRLFSTFASGWPGIGLLIQRILTSVLLIRFGMIELTGSSFSPSMIPPIVGVCAGMLLLIGLWTPVVGMLIVGIELWVAVTDAGSPWASIVLATFGGTLAMIGPGAWSIDARLFGRKHIEA
jgi:hypothetical protein